MKNNMNHSVSELSLLEQKTINGGGNWLLEKIKEALGIGGDDDHPCGGIGSQSRNK